jgi:hypothetical protein
MTEKESEILYKNIYGIKDETDWMNKLTKGQRKHLKDMDIKTLREFISAREYQIQNNKIGNGREICWDCRDIARTLEICQEESEIMSELKVYKVKVVSCRNTDVVIALASSEEEVCDMLNKNIYYRSLNGFGFETSDVKEILCKPGFCWVATEESC